MIDASKFKLSLKIKVSKPKRAKYVPPNKKLTKLITGKVLYKDGKYRCLVKYIDFKDRLANNVTLDMITNTHESLVFKFADESFDASKFNVIFTREIYEDNGYLCIIRDRTHVLTFPADNNRFLPFAPKWLVRGWIVSINNEVRFKFHSVITVEGYDYNFKKLKDDDEIEWKIKK